MCWISKIKPKPKVAEEDMAVYKYANASYITKKSVYALIYPHRYIIDKNNKNIRLNILRNLVIDGNQVHTINEGYHSYADLETARKKHWCSSHLAHFTIPKGTKYYINEKNEIVSENIIYNKLSNKYV